MYHDHRAVSFMLPYVCPVELEREVVGQTRRLLTSGGGKGESCAVSTPVRSHRRIMQPRFSCAENPLTNVLR